MEITQKKYDVFISYSHEDSKYISPIIKFVRALRNDLVFQDTEDIKPGKLWEPQILNALSQSSLVIVFWCKHSQASAYVSKEYKLAIKENKDVLPLLLDNTKLSEDLSAYQWIDLREVFVHKTNYVKKVKKSDKRFPAAFDKKPGSKKTGSPLEKVVSTSKKDKHLISFPNSYAESLTKIGNKIVSKLNEKIPPVL